ncbi:MAG: UDP-N-acetylglucosamine 2-epimerase (non-hydrolyzing) [Myxococcales bacterium]|nr:UDP-N-acetylglucosamine 2-epimerase (non-hydrolyzing) [Myxococcales bacterium]
MKRVLVICGTRPEGIKLAPVMQALLRRPAAFHATLCVTGQHRQMLDPILKFFSLVPEFDLDLMRPGQTLTDVTAGALPKLKQVIQAVDPDWVLVQGDTTTAFAGALAAFYEKKRVGHVEAGLRTGDRYSPFPEEMNRSLITRLADLHFAPTETARERLAAEGVTQGVHVTGNTVIDALVEARRLVEAQHEAAFAQEFKAIDPARPLVLITGHRRESFGAPFESICRAIKTLATRFPAVQFVYPVHLNPNVREPVDRLLRGVPGVTLIEPVDYPRLVWLLSKSTVVLTDSGGIQEEAPSFGKPVLVMRDVTERPEGIAAGCARLVGTSEARIVDEVSTLLTDRSAWEAMAKARNPYGDGTAAEQIVALLAQAG